jgi:AcrR family transcriptional regulator
MARAPKPASTTAGAAASRREQRRLQHQDLSRAQLLDAAEEVFGAKGFHETTLKEVAELAEFSVGSVYSFFQNKDDLFLNVFLRRGAEFLPGMDAAAGDCGGAPTFGVPRPRARTHARVLVWISWSAIPSSPLPPRACEADVNVTSCNSFASES